MTITLIIASQLVLQFRSQHLEIPKPELDRLIRASSEGQAVKRLLKAGRIQDAGSRLETLASLGVTEEELSWYRSDIAIRVGDLVSARSNLKTYFVGRPGVKRLVSGEPCAQIWRWWLERPFVSSETSNQMFEEFLNKNKTVMPNSMDTLDVKGIRTDNQTRALLWLAAFEIRTGNLLRAKAYLACSKKSDPGCKIPEGFVLELKRYHTIKTQEEQIDEAQGGFVSFDPYSPSITKQKD
jgi:hypothetical protein